MHQSSPQLLGGEALTAPNPSSTPSPSLPARANCGVLAGVSLLMVVALAMTTGGLAEFLPALAVTGARMAAEATPVRVTGQVRREAERIRPSGLAAAELAGTAIARAVMTERSDDEGRDARGSARVRVALLSLPPPMMMRA